MSNEQSIQFTRATGREIILDSKNDGEIDVQVSDCDGTCVFYLAVDEAQQLRDWLIKVLP